MGEKGEGGGLSAIAKLMLSIREESYQIISAEARERCVSVQELLRAVILPEWVKDNIAPSTAQQPLREVAPRMSNGSTFSAQRDPFLKAIRPRT
jgi:hypothetical protein